MRSLPEFGMAMADAGIVDAGDVHFVQVKCPLLTIARTAEAEARGANVATRDTLKSMGLSRAASALGVAVALDEIAPSRLSDADIGSRWDWFSARASCSAGVELLGHEIVVFGMSQSWSGPLAIDHAVMQDAIDIEPVRSALARLGLAVSGQIPKSERERLVAVLAKAEASHNGRLRGHRHTMLDDSDISSTRHARAFVCGALAGLVGHAEIYVSGGAETSGPGWRRTGGADRRQEWCGLMKDPIFQLRLPHGLVPPERANVQACSPSRFSDHQAIRRMAGYGIFKSAEGLGFSTVHGEGRADVRCCPGHRI